MHNYDHLDLSHLKAKKVTYKSFLADLKAYPVSTHVDRGKRLGCWESNIRRMFDVLNRLKKKHETQVLNEPIKKFVIDYKPHNVYGYDAASLISNLNKINSYPNLEKYLDEDAKEILLHVIEDLTKHPDSLLSDRLRRLALIKIHTFTRYNVWKVIFWVRFLFKRHETYKKL